MDYDEYVTSLKGECDRIYELVQEARSKGVDPKPQVEIPLAHDLADRTQKLLDFLHPRTTAQQIRDLTKEFDGNREKVALKISEIVMAESYLYGERVKCPTCVGSGKIKKGYREFDCDVCEGIGYTLDYNEGINNSWKETLDLLEKEDLSKPQDALASLCIYHGVCAGLAVLTEGILVAPLEGVVSARVIDNSDGTKAIAINYAGPIRSAGGTGQALSVLIADILRRRFGYSKPVMEFEEIERYKEEVSKYRGLQYRPSNPQLEVIGHNCPIFIDGEGVGQEVTGSRDLLRVRDNRVREGALLVLCEGLVLKAPKIMKYVNELGLDGWDWLKDFIKTGGKSTVIKPNAKYMGDLLAGRPLFAMPMAVGGFRLRYGRSRLAGLATTAVHPATMNATCGFMSIGTQLKQERPGKGTVVTPCTEIDGPYVQWADGSAQRIQKAEDLPPHLATDVEYEVSKIWDLGEMLVPVGEFLENNHPLPPSPYVHEWHSQVVEEKGLVYPQTFAEALNQTTDLGVMAPEYVAMYQDITDEDLIHLANVAQIKNGKVWIPQTHIETIYRLNIDVDAQGNIYGDAAQLLINSLSALKTQKSDQEDGLELMNKIYDFDVKPRATLRIGARMGKPEGAKMRDMKPSKSHALFPIGSAGKQPRHIAKAAQNEEAVNIGVRICPVTEEKTYQGCKTFDDGSVIETRFVDTNKEKLGLNDMWREAMSITQMTDASEVKGVKSLAGPEAIPENLGKGILRCKHDLSVFRDGTIRWDMVDITMTHFKPREIGMSLQKAHELGYNVYSIDDVIELKPQDVVIPTCVSESILRTTHYIDELLVKVYGMDPFYNCTTVEDLFGQLIMGIAPHTSGAILGRMIGMVDVKGHYGHPFYHAAKRRNCDGDIDAIMLLFDGLLNFSRAFLPRFRGGQMDAPLILTTQISPSEIDKEALNVDINDQYPIAFYEVTQQNPPPEPKAALKAGVITVGDMLGTPQEISGFGYTHSTESAVEGPPKNPYNDSSLNLSMRQKTMAQFALGTVLEAVDNKKQSARLIDSHLIRDMRGNLRAFGQQKVRCTKCGAKYRRPPIGGKCTTITATRKNAFSGEMEEIICPGTPILTVSYGSVSKYDDLMETIIEQYGCEEYIAQLYTHVSKWVAQTFEDKNAKKQTKLW